MGQLAGKVGNPGCNRAESSDVNKNCAQIRLMAQFWDQWLFEDSANSFIIEKFIKEKYKKFEFILPYGCSESTDYT